jgi:hypothetical protein
MKVGDLVMGTDGRIKGRLGLITELRYPHIDALRVLAGGAFKPTNMAVLWRSGEHQKWINPKFLKKVVDNASE